MAKLRRSLFSDNFNRADNADLGADWATPAGGAGWGQGFKIETNQARATDDTGFDACEIVTSVTWPNDQYASLSVSNLHSGAAIGEGYGPGVRIAASGANDEGYYLAINANAGGNLAICKVAVSVKTLLKSFVVPSLENVVCTIEVVGNWILAYRAGVLIGDVRDSSIASGSAGICYDTFSVAEICDNFEAGAIESGIANRLFSRHPKPILRPIVRRR